MIATPTPSLDVRVETIRRLSEFEPWTLAQCLRGVIQQACDEQGTRLLDVDITLDPRRDEVRLIMFFEERES